MGHGKTLFMVCYDIADDKRRRKVAEILLGRGTRVQYSVFRCALSERQLAELEWALDDEIHDREDQVLVVRLGKAGSRGEWPVTVLGKGLEGPSRDVRVI